MIVHLHVDLPHAIWRRQVKIKVPDEATVSDVLAAYAQKYKVDGILEKTSGTSVVVNGGRGSLERVLKHKDRVKVFKPRIRG